MADEALSGQWMDGDGLIVVIGDSDVRWPDGQVLELDARSKGVLEITREGKAWRGKVSRDGMWLVWSSGDTWIRVPEGAAEEPEEERARLEPREEEWANLSAGERAALQHLGYTQQSWDAELPSAAAAELPAEATAGEAGAGTASAPCEPDSCQGTASPDERPSALSAEEGQGHASTPVGVPPAIAGAAHTAPMPEGVVGVPAPQSAECMQAGLAEAADVSSAVRGGGPVTETMREAQADVATCMGAEVGEKPAAAEAEAADAAARCDPQRRPPDAKNAEEVLEVTEVVREPEAGVAACTGAEVLERPAAAEAEAADAAARRDPQGRPPGAGDAEEEVLEFPPGFLWGTGTAAYQIEGAATEGGRTPSIWDTFSATPGKVQGGHTGAVACDHYHRWPGDVRLMKDLGLPAYRFSISWSRLLPTGRAPPNPEAVAFYGALLDELVGQGIKPVVTIYHWDLPQCLEDEYGGWRSRKAVEDFEAYAAVCFSSFGDRVPLWLTFNEPWCSAVLGYANGEMAPGRDQAPEREPYVVAHHILLAHAHAVRRYRRDFQRRQGGQVGITLNMDWKEPCTSCALDSAAQERAVDWQLGWFADPIWKGDYPKSMRQRCGARLPSFTDAEKKLLCGSSDFFGLNHYSTTFVCAPSGLAKTLSGLCDAETPGSYFDDKEVQERDDPRWARTDMKWSVVPWGLKHLCECIQRRYSPAGGIIIMENGCAVKEESVAAAENDTLRVEYLRSYLAQLHKAIQGGVDVRGYFVWSFMDNYEWHHGYTKRFGIVHVDYTTQERTVKASAKFLSEVARTNALRVSSRELAASDFRPLAEREGERAPADSQQELSQKPKTEQAESRLGDILKDLSAVRQRLVALQAEEPSLMAKEGHLIDGIAEEAHSLVQAAEMMAPVHPAAIAVYRDFDAFAEENAHEQKVDSIPSLEERTAFGVSMCGYLGFGGFCVYNDTLYFRAHSPEVIETCRRPAQNCLLVVVRRAERPPLECTVIPMGHSLTTTSFLQQTGWRHQALPLDWCQATFKVWQHMLSDDFATLLRPPGSAGDEHPYNSMFPDVRMFARQGGWANVAVHRRVLRLRAILEQRRAFGLALYFEGEDGGRASIDDIAADARSLAESGHGFFHIALVWLQRPRSLRPAATWWDFGSCTSVLQYSPSKLINHWDRLPAEDAAHILELLEERFPHVLPRSQRSCGPPPSCEQDTGRHWIDLEPGKEAEGPCVRDGCAGGEGPLWTVVGGLKGGIVVRKDRSVRSPELGRLAKNTRVREVELDGERLHYEKVDGDGPDFGWVSVRLKGTDLLTRD